MIVVSNSSPLVGLGASSVVGDPVLPLLAAQSPVDNQIMNLNVPEKWKLFIRSKMRSGHYRSEDEVLDEALRRLKQRDSEHTQEKMRIEALLID